MYQSGNHYVEESTNFHILAAYGFSFIPVRRDISANHFSSSLKAIHSHFSSSLDYQSLHFRPRLGTFNTHIKAFGDK